MIARARVHEAGGLHQIVVTVRAGEDPKTVATAIRVFGYKAILAT